MYIIGNARHEESTTLLINGIGAKSGETNRARQGVMDLLSVLSRVIPASYFAIVCYGFWRNFLQTGKWTSLLWMVSEGMVVLLLVFRRESRQLSRSSWDWLVALGGAFTVLLVRPSTTSIVPDAVGVLFQVAGTLFEVYGKLSLGRSFGVVAANRGVVVAGPYRIVRHPIYLGYFVSHLGFLLANWSMRNIAVYVISTGFQWARILSEERLLKEEEAYRAYCERVRYRLIPYVL